ncbi:hypothetical protein C0991_009960 [Blastosporella zonata]|nr:hypothetical protein C0991_009960 [Blastosporella zonata]
MPRKARTQSKSDRRMPCLGTHHPEEKVKPDGMKELDAVAAKNDTVKVMRTLS